MSTSHTHKKNIYALSPEELQTLVLQMGESKFRVQQISDWLYNKRVTSFAQMTNISKELRTKLEDMFVFGWLQVEMEQNSADGTKKRLYRLHDGKLIESVLMPYQDGRRTACISSQAGCAMACSFCATGQMGFSRHLSAAEIFEQAQQFANELQEQGERLSNIVLMGMGEPFHNYDAVIEAIGLLRDRLGIGARKITVSTVGLVPKIRAFAQEGLQVKLAISLHSTVNEDRSKIMPINKKYPVEELMQACREFVEATGRRITFEYALIHGKNDTVEEATRLQKLLQGLLCHVNVIPLNPTAGYDGTPSDPQRVAEFVAVLEKSGIPATVRVRRGIDIDAGCGQLQSKRILGTNLA